MKQENNKKITNKKQKWLTVMLVLFISIIFIGIGVIFYYLIHAKKSTDAFKSLKPIEEYSDGEELEYCLVDGQKVQTKFKDLYIKNRDFIGWISIDDTNVDYPVMQSDEDEQFYLHKNFDKEYDYAGCIFASTFSDIERPSDNILLYGHHMNTGIMFTPLMNYEDQNWAEEHKYITFDTLYENATYEVIAAFRTQLYGPEYNGFIYYEYINAETRADFDDYIYNITSLSSISINANVEYGDKLLSLSTCAYHTSNGRFVVVAKKIESLPITDYSILKENIVTKEINTETINDSIFEE